MTIDIIDEEELYINCDTYIVDEYDVRIELPCYPSRPAILLNNKNGVPMLAKEFVGQVKQCKATGKSLSIDWEMDKEPRAWISGCADGGNIENAKCEIKNLKNSVIIHVVG